MKSYIRVLHVAATPKTLRFLRGQGAFMRERQIEVIFCSSPGMDLDRLGKEENVTTVGVDIMRYPSVLRDVVSLWRLYRVIRRLRPDVVHTHTPKAGLLGGFAARIAGVPLRVHQLHGLRFTTLSGLKRIITKMGEMVTCRLAEQVLAVSFSLAEVATWQGVCVREKMSVLGQGTASGVDAKKRFNPNRINLDEVIDLKHRMGITGDSLVIGFVGRVVNDKGIAELVIAWDILKERFPQVKLLVVGPLEEEDSVKPEILERLKNDDRVIVVGEVENPEAYYALMDVLVLPSRREGFGMAALEAGAMEVAVVVTQIPGCVDAVIDGVTGIFVPAINAPGLADGISLCLADPELRRKFGKAARRRALRHFDSETIWRELASVYNKGVSIKSANLDRVRACDDA